MPVSRRQLIAASPALLAIAAAPRRAAAAAPLTVAFAGSMTVVMDRGIGPAFTAQTGTPFHGIGQPAMALAHLLAAKTMVADVFVSVSAGPIKIVEAAKLASAATPVASTEFVLTYSPKSKFAPQFATADARDAIRLLTAPGLRLGRTDPQVDPQGAYLLYCLQLAEIFYQQPGLADQVTGAMENPAQIFAEPSLLARLQEGQLDATLGYKSAVISQKLPFITLPPEINFSSPALAKTTYAQAKLTLKGKTAHPSPLVFYATALTDAANPAAAAAFITFLSSPAGQALFAKYGYGPGKGPAV